MHADLQRLLAPDLLADFGSLSMERLRQLRTELTNAEGDISMVRRVTQGRLDIIGHEVDRRSQPASGADTAPADPSGGDPSELLFDMPDILSDGTGPANRSGARDRHVPVTEPGPLAAELIESLDAIAAPGQLAGVGELDGPTLSDLFEGLRALEVELSTSRRALHDRIDTIQDEIARRYRDGEASVDALLR